MFIDYADRHELLTDHHGVSNSRPFIHYRKKKDAVILMFLFFNQHRWYLLYSISHDQLCLCQISPFRILLSPSVDPSNKCRPLFAPSAAFPRSQHPPFPSHLHTILILIHDSAACLMRLPFFLLPLMFHTPLYIMGRLGASLVEDEEETQAQNKVVFGLLFLLLIYPATFMFLWALFWFTPTGALLAAGIIYLFAIYHNRLINDNYEQ